MMKYGGSLGGGKAEDTAASKIEFLKQLPFEIDSLNIATLEEIDSITEIIFQASEEVY